MYATFIKINEKFCKLLKISTLFCKISTMEFLKLTKYPYIMLLIDFGILLESAVTKSAIYDHFSQKLTGNHSYHRISQKITGNHRKSQSITGYHKTLKDHSKSQEITEYHRRSQKPWEGLHSRSQP